MANVDKVKEHHRLIRLSEMLRHGDTLDHKVLDVMKLVFKELPTDEGPAQFEHEDIKELLLGLPTAEVFLSIPTSIQAPSSST